VEAHHGAVAAHLGAVEAHLGGIFHRFLVSDSAITKN
jgi:hypothetical protein